MCESNLAVQHRQYSSNVAGTEKKNKHRAISKKSQYINRFAIQFTDLLPNGCPLWKHTKVIELLIIQANLFPSDQEMARYIATVIKFSVISYNQLKWKNYSVTSIIKFRSNPLWTYPMRARLTDAYLPTCITNDNFFQFARIILKFLCWAFVILLRLKLILFWVIVIVLFWSKT